MADSEHHNADQRLAVHGVFWSAADRSGSGRSGPAGSGWQTNIVDKPDNPGGLFRLGTKQLFFFPDYHQFASVQIWSKSWAIRFIGKGHVSRAGVQGF